MNTSKVQRFMAAGFVAAALAVASLGATGVSASPEHDDSIGSYNAPQQVVVQPFTSEYAVNAVPVLTPGYTVNAVPFAPASGNQVDNSINRNN